MPTVHAQVIRPATKTLLEEPRAELTALHTLRLMRAGGHLEQAGPLALCLRHGHSFP